MKVYKYRGVANLKRDLACLVEDSFFAPTVEQLNDPTEAVLNDELAIALATAVREQGPDLSTSIEQAMSMRFSEGIYSLSRTPADELMWAHYADSHKGFCIEYDLGRLMAETWKGWRYFDVVYSQDPPIFTFDDLRSGSHDAALRKLVGHKSLRWSYESEVRLLAPSGINRYPRAAVTGVVFGCRCSRKTEVRVRRALRERTHSYSRVVFPPTSYQLDIERLARGPIDGAPPERWAPVEEGTVMSTSDLGEFADRYVELLGAVERVRRDASCARIVWADICRTGSHRGEVFVQFETTDESALGRTATWYFDRASGAEGA